MYQLLNLPTYFFRYCRRTLRDTSSAIFQSLTYVQMYVRRYAQGQNDGWDMKYLVSLNILVGHFSCQKGVTDFESNVLMCSFNNIWHLTFLSQWYVYIYADLLSLSIFNTFFISFSPNIRFILQLDKSIWPHLQLGLFWLQGAPDFWANIW